MGKLLRSTKQLYYDYMSFSEETGDNFYENPKADNSYSLSVVEKHFIKRYLSLIVTSNIVSDSTKSFLRYPALTSDRQTFQSIINEQRSKKRLGVYNYNTCIAMLAYDEKKLLKFFDADMLDNIMKARKKEYNMSDYERQLNIAIAKFGKVNDLVNELELKVPITELESNVTDLEFNKLLEIIKPFSKSAMKQLVDMMPDNYKQYINYLFFVDNKSALDQERYTKLEKMLRDGYSQAERKEIADSFADLQSKDEPVSVEKAEIPKVETKFVQFDIVKPDDKELDFDDLTKKEKVDDVERKFNILMDKLDEQRRKMAYTNKDNIIQKIKKYGEVLPNKDDIVNSNYNWYINSSGNAQEYYRF